MHGGLDRPPIRRYTVAAPEPGGGHSSRLLRFGIYRTGAVASGYTSIRRAETADRDVQKAYGTPICPTTVPPLPTSIPRRDSVLLVLAVVCGLVSYAARVEYLSPSIPSPVEWGIVVVLTLSLTVAFVGGRRGFPRWSSLAPTVGTSLGGTLGWQWANAHDGFTVLPGTFGSNPWFVVGLLTVFSGVVAFGIGRWVRRHSSKLTPSVVQKP